MQDVPAAAQQSFGGKRDRLPDQVILRVFQRAAGDAEHGAGQLAVRQVLAQAVFGVLDDAQDLPRVLCADLGESRGEIAADVQQHQFLPGGA